MEVCGRCATACHLCAETCQTAEAATPKPQGGCCQGN
jgi:hypothetical protein